LILALETSCDETSAAVVADGATIRSNLISSQISAHRKFGGVVPEIASRKHLEAIGPVVRAALAEAGIGFADLDAIAVVPGPGLVGALLVGVAVAKALAYALRLPLIGVHHIEGHIYANFLAHPDMEFPLLCLVVSGGHSSLVFMKEHGNFELLGQTRDDAAGEAFDKVARALALGYPGGPAIERLAVGGNPEAIAFPRARLGGSLDFSFSGLKTAVLNYVHRAREAGGEIGLPDLAASFQQAVVDVLVEKTVRAARERGVPTIALAGGVAANQALRRELTARGNGEGIRVCCPPVNLCTDNAAMVGCAAYYRHLRGETAPWTLNAVPYLELGAQF
jgi:N6-L-threonylcarbamoyladenine synthase